MDSELITVLEHTHLAVWNERNRTQRDSMMGEIYADEIKMYDPNLTLNGVKDVSDFIDKVQADPAFDFKATQPMERVQNGARLFWTITTEKGPLTGMDFFILENEKVTQLYVFIAS